MSKRKQTFDLRTEPSVVRAADQRLKSRVFRARNKKLVEWVKISELTPKQNPRFNREEFCAEFEVRHNFRRIPDLMAYQLSIDNAFGEALRPFLDEMESNDMISCSIFHEDLTEPIYLWPQKKRNFSDRLFLDRIYETSQSKRSFLFNGVLTVRVNITKALTGRGRGSKAPTSYSEVDSNKRSIIRVKSLESYPNACGYQSITLGMKWHEWSVKGDAHQNRWKDMLKRETKQEKPMIEFCMAFDLDPRVPLNVDILKALDLKIEYQLIVIEKGLQRFKGSDKSNVIYLLFDGEHYDLIISMPGYLSRNFYCKTCNKGYKHAVDHRCESSCFLCRASGSKICPINTKKQCSKCMVSFPSSQCFENHLANKICKERHYCMDCERNYETKHVHRCDEFHCKQCNEWYTVQPHLCYMKPLDAVKLAEEDAKLKILVSYDIESMIRNDGNHEPILLIAHTICDKGNNCGICGQKERLFYGKDCVQRFVGFLLELSKIAEKNKAQITAFAHNASGYDGQFVMRELIRREIKFIDPILDGSRILRLDVGNIRFMDSWMLFRAPLSELPKMFSLSGEAKGFFPHKANTEENQELRCRLSDFTYEDFGIKHWKPKVVNEFKIWRRDNADMVYDFRGEMIKYCRSDVTILMKAMEEFKRLFKEVTGIDPLTRCFTLASIGMEFFRAKILTPKIIGITPIGGYTLLKDESLSAKAWLDCMEREYGSIVREYKIGNFQADGYIPQSKTVFEFNGCVWHGHGCKKEFYDREKLKRVEEKKAYYERRGLKCVFEWECEWKDKCMSGRDGIYYRKRLNHYIKLKSGKTCDPRKALHGGRTNNLKFMHKISREEEMRYLDFTSLYPSVLAHNWFPGGHPEVYTCNFPPIESVFGFVSCKVLPPQDLYPVLPFSTNGKLVFSLCRTCAEEQNQSSCSHNIEQRCFTDTFVSVELFKALEKGYKILEVYEVLHYKKPIKDQFQEYINKWYKIKAEASGFPSNCVTEEQKQEFIKEFKKREGIDLDCNKICKNSGLRTLAKLMLNSIWGKFAQRPNMTETKIVNDYPELWDIFNDQKKRITGEVMIEDLMLISYKNKDVLNSRVGNTSVAIAAFVTAYARLKLNKVIERIEESSSGSVLYFDTDSVVFVQKPETYCPKISNFLGDMTDEIADEYGIDARMSEFYTTGPKCYAFKVETPNGSEIKIKVKGITQSIAAAERLNFESMQELAENKAQNLPNTEIRVPQLQFRCDKYHRVKTIELEKRFGVTSDKRRIVGNETLPYGWVDETLDSFTELMISF